MTYSSKNQQPSNNLPLNDFVHALMCLPAHPTHPYISKLHFSWDRVFFSTWHVKNNMLPFDPYSYKNNNNNNNKAIIHRMWFIVLTAKTWAFKSENSPVHSADRCVWRARRRMHSVCWLARSFFFSPSHSVFRCCCFCRSKKKHQENQLPIELLLAWRLIGVSLSM